MFVLQAASEVVPFAKTGGLADVAGTLPKYMKKNDVECAVILPLYKKVKESTAGLKSTGVTISVPVGEHTLTGILWEATLPGTDIPAYFIQRDEFFHRDGLYVTGDKDYWDNAQRFIFYSRGVLEAAEALGLKVDVFHCHDWQSALIPVYLKTLYAGRNHFRGAKSLLTIHNLAYQGVFWHWDMKLTGFDWSLFHWKRLEFWGKLNFLKGGIVYADALTTVSPRYAREIQTEEFGCGLHGVIRDRGSDLTGIINGVDYAVWSPEVDSLIASKFSASKLAGKAKCKAQLQKKCKLPASDAPVIGVISRLVDQKGFDLFAKVAPELLKQDVQIVVLGTGDERYHRFFNDLAARNPKKVSIHLTFDNTLAHEIEAGSDMFLMPSRFEPCGLNQLYSLKYGTIPVVRETGGLADSIVNATPESIEKGTATGFSFAKYEPPELWACLQRALAAYADKKTWAKLVKTAMEQDFSWERSAREYAELYRRLSGHR